MSENNKPHEADDRKLFQEAMKEVIPLSPMKTTSTLSKSASLNPNLAYRRRAAEHFTEKNNQKQKAQTVGKVDLPFSRPGVQKGLLRKMQRHKISIEDTLDLHGLQVEEALAQVDKFVEQSQMKGFHLICIVHGIGTGKLKQAIIYRLYQENSVLACCEVNSGAVFVLIKTKI